MFHALDKHIAAGELTTRLTPDKVCQQHHDQLARSDVIDVEVKQLASASITSTTIDGI